MLLCLKMLELIIFWKLKWHFLERKWKLNLREKCSFKYLNFSLNQNFKNFRNFLIKGNGFLGKIGECNVKSKNRKFIEIK